MRKLSFVLAASLALAVAGCDDLFGGDEVTVTVTGRANVRDAATTEGSNVLTALDAGTQLKGKWVTSATNPSERWFAYERDGKTAYIWEGNLKQSKALAATNKAEGQGPLLEEGQDFPVKFASEHDFSAALGNPTRAMSAQTKVPYSPELLKKKLGTSVGAQVSLPRFWVMSRDDSEWVSGGNLYIYNDDSMGSEFRVTCVLSPEDGDKFMENTRRREVDIKGSIENYSTSYGLRLNPCVVTKDVGISF